MAMTPSNMIELGTIAPDFTLLDTLSGENKSLADCRSDTATVVMFICNHCPFVIHIIDHLISTIGNYQDKGVSFVAISANDPVTYPDDAPDKMTEFANTHGFSFPYLFDETQAIAKAYDAACTPDFYIFDKDLACVYRGQYDAARPGNAVPVTGEDLTSALDNILDGKPVSANQVPSIGCNIKWRD